MCMCDDGNSVFHAKSNICTAKVGNLGANGVKGSKFLVKNVIFAIADPDLPIHYAIFMGLNIKGSLLLRALIIKHFRRKKFGNLVANGVKGSKFLFENVIFEIADPDLLIHYATFMGLR